MKDKIIVSDFDGTITTKDALYEFMEKYADKKWLEIEQNWRLHKMNSQDCLIEEFNLIPNLSAELIDNFIDTVKIDSYFIEFNEIRLKNNVDFLIVSDGLDYFIKKILQKNKIKNIKIISNHAEFQSEKFLIKFPNKAESCTQQAGTCKCNVIKNLKKQYKEIYYIGDGNSDKCVANKVDYLFAKSELLEYCNHVNINCIEFKNFKEVINYDRLGFNF